MRMRTLVSAAALTAATLAAVVATEGSAEAASVKKWDRIAHCESGGRWHINTGNGYYGGLQISPSTWRSYGGKKFARLPHKATKREQVRVAKKIQKRQGWRAWPACSRRIGKR